MRAPRFLISKRLSSCCGYSALVVQSRNGGFVSQDCLKCLSTSQLIKASDLPDLVCETCEQALTVRVIDKNYFYVCQRCNDRWMIWSNVPNWRVAFSYAGLAAADDEKS